MAFTDNFNGAVSNTNLGDWTPSGGTAWTHLDGAANWAEVSTTDRLILNNNSDSSGASFLCDDQGSADQYVQYVVEDDAVDAFVCNRLTDRLNFIGVRSSGSNVQLFKRVGGTFTSLGTGSTTVVVGNVIRLESDGDSHTAYLNGVVEIGPVTDSAHNTETRQGVVARNTPSARAWLDDFEAGTLTVTTTGTAAQTFASLIQAASAKETFEGSAAQTFAGLMQAASGSSTQGTSGTAAQTFQKLMQALTGAEKFTGTAVQILPAPIQTALGAQRFSGAAAQTMPVLIQTASGRLRFIGTLAQVLPRLLQAATGTEKMSGAVVQLLPRLLQSSAGTVAENVSGTAIQILPALMQATFGTVETAEGGKPRSLIMVLKPGRWFN